MDRASIRATASSSSASSNSATIEYNYPDIFDDDSDYASGFDSYPSSLISRETLACSRSVNGRRYFSRRQVSPSSHRRTCFDMLTCSGECRSIIASPTMKRKRSGWALFTESGP